MVRPKLLNGISGVVVESSDSIGAQWSIHSDAGSIAIRPQGKVGGVVVGVAQNEKQYTIHQGEVVSSCEEIFSHH